MRLGRQVGHICSDESGLDVRIDSLPAGQRVSEIKHFGRGPLGTQRRLQVVLEGVRAAPSLPQHVDELRLWAAGRRADDEYVGVVLAKNET